MKTVILANDTDATSSQLRALMPALGEPDRSNTSDTGIRYDYWTALDDTHFEVVSMKQEVATDTVAVIFLVVDDLDAAIQVFGVAGGIVLHGTVVPECNRAFLQRKAAHVFRTVVLP